VMTKDGLHKTKLAEKYVLLTHFPLIVHLD